MMVNIWVKKTLLGFQVKFVEIYGCRKHKSDQIT